MKVKEIIKTLEGYKTKECDRCSKDKPNTCEQGYACAIDEVKALLLSTR